MNEYILNNEQISITQPKIKNKFKIVLTVIIFFAFIITISILLIGHFKFNWFNNEIYNIDIKISRNEYQTNFFNEKKTIKTKVGFTNGVDQKNELEIFIDFMVVQTDKKRSTNEKDLINNATLVILDAKANIKNEPKDIISFNIFNESIVNEFKSNPNGELYPMSIFSFYENGTINNIKLPNNMNKNNAFIIIELIEKIIPKLSRNKTEDISKGLAINIKKDREKRILVESQSPREINKFRGSKLSKTVERDVENEHLVKIISNANLDLRTEKKNEQVDFGLKEFRSEEESIIFSKGIKKEKEIVELVEKLSEYYTFISSTDLIQLLSEKENDGKKVYDLNEKKRKIGSKKTKIRKLGLECSFCVMLKNFNILGIDIDVFFDFEAMGDKFSAGLSFFVQDLDFYFGTNGASYSYSHYYGDWTLLRFQFPPMPAIGVALKAGGTITIKQKINREDKPRIVISLSGSISAKAEVSAGWDKFVSISAGAEGTIISSSLSGNINDDLSVDIHGKISGGDIKVYVEGKAMDHSIFKMDYQVWGGWSNDVF